MISIIVWFPVSLPRTYNLFNTKILMWSQIQRAFPWMRQFYQKHPRHWCFWKPWKLQAKSQRNTDPESLVLHWCRGDFYPSCPSVFGHVLGFFGPSCRSSQHPTLCGPSVELEWYGEISLNHIKAISRRLVFFGKPLYCFKNGWKKHKQCIRKPKTSVYFHKPLESCIMIRYIWIYISHLCDVSFWKNHVDHSLRAGVTSIEPFLHVNLNHGNLRGPPPPMPRFLLK